MKTCVADPDDFLFVNGTTFANNRIGIYVNILLTLYWK
jgi:hypothetical protein